MWSKGQKATRSSVNMARHQPADFHGDLALGKRDPADLSKQEFEQTSVKDASGSRAELSRQGPDAKRIKPFDSDITDMVVSLVDEKLKANSPWLGDLSRLKKSKNRAESEEVSAVPSGRREKEKKEGSKTQKKIEEQPVVQGPKRKTERIESMVEEEIASRDKLAKRDHPFK